MPFWTGNMFSEKASITFDGKCTIRNEKMEWDDVAHYGSAAVLPASFGNGFAINENTLD